MGNLILTSQYGQNITSEEATATLNDVVKGKTALTSDSKDGLASGTLELTGTASPARVIAGSTFYSIDPHNKETGVMANVAAIDPSKSVTLSGGVVYARMTNGAHIQNASSGYPEVSIQQPALASAVGLTGAKLGVGHNVLGIAGTYGNDATATAPYLAKGYTAYGKTGKITGTMTVSSVVSFSAAAYSTSQVLCTWKNPAKGPYSGVIIRYKTGSYPTGVSDGSGYQGIGSNSNLNAASSFTIGGLAAGTTYYFRIWMYCNTSLGTIYSNNYLQTACMPTAHGRKAFTSSTNFTIPSGVRLVNVHCTGGGAAGGSNTYSAVVGAGGGAGGYTSYKNSISVSPGEILNITVGNGGTPSMTKNTASLAGGTSSVHKNGLLLVSASGGGACSYEKSTKSSNSSTCQTKSNGGSGGGAGGYRSSAGGTGLYNYYASGNGGTDGANGFGCGYNSHTGSSGTAFLGTGQGRTTKEFGTGTLYSGGGGGGACCSASSSNSYGKRTATFGGSGGTGGGGKGADNNTVYTSSSTSSKQQGTVAGNGSAGSGGGGGGGKYINYSSGLDIDYNAFQRGGRGGTGNVIITW